MVQDKVKVSIYSTSCFLTSMCHGIPHEWTKGKCFKWILSKHLISETNFCRLDYFWSLMLVSVLVLSMIINDDIKMPGDRNSLCWLLLSSWPKLELPEKRTAQLRNCLHQHGLWASLEGIFLIANWCRRALPATDCAIPRQPGLGPLKKEQNKPEESKPVDTGLYFISTRQVPLAPHPYFGFLLWWTVTQKPDESFLAQAAFGDAVYQSNRNKTRILIRPKKHRLHLQFWDDGTLDWRKQLFWVPRPKKKPRQISHH